MGRTGVAMVAEQGDGGRNPSGFTSEDPSRGVLL